MSAKPVNNIHLVGEVGLEESGMSSVTRQSPGLPGSSNGPGGGVVADEGTHEQGTHAPVPADLLPQHLSCEVRFIVEGHRATG